MLQVGGYPSSTNVTNVKTGYVFQNGVKKYLWKDNLCYDGYDDNYWTNFYGFVKDINGFGYGGKIVAVYDYKGTLKYGVVGETASGYMYRIRTCVFGNYAIVQIHNGGAVLSAFISKINDDGTFTSMSSSTLSKYTGYKIVSFGLSGIYLSLGGELYYSQFNKDNLNVTTPILVENINLSLDSARRKRDTEIKICPDGSIFFLDLYTKEIKLVRNGIIVKNINVSSLYPESLSNAFIEGAYFIGIYTDTNDVVKSRAYNLMTGEMDVDKTVTLNNGVPSTGRGIDRYTKLHKMRIDSTHVDYPIMTKVNNDNSVVSSRMNKIFYYSVPYIDKDGNFGMYQLYDDSSTNYIYQYTLDGINFTTFTGPSNTTTNMSALGSPMKGMLFVTLNDSSTTFHVSEDNGSTWKTIEARE